MKVFTYFNPVPEMDVSTEHKLIVLWQHAWRMSGYEPVILTHLHADAHPQWAEVDELVRSFPTVNPVDYELACWHRWLALAQVGGGLMVDYDVIPRAVDADMLCSIPDDVAVLDAGGVP